MSAIDLSKFNDPERMPEPDQVQGSMLPPATIRLKDGASVTTREQDNIQWHQFGVFVTGFVEDEGDEVDWLVPYTEVKRYEFDFKALLGEPDGTSPSD